MSQSQIGLHAWDFKTSIGVVSIGGKDYFLYLSFANARAASSER